MLEAQTKAGLKPFGPPNYLPPPLSLYLPAQQRHLFGGWRPLARGSDPGPSGRVAGFERWHGGCWADQRRPRLNQSHALPRAAANCHALPRTPSAVASRPRPLTLRLRDFHPSCDDIFRTALLQSLVVLDDTNCKLGYCVDKVSIQKNLPPKLRRLSALAARTDCTANLRFWSRPRRGTRWWTKASTRSCSRYRSMPVGTTARDRAGSR